VSPDADYRYVNVATWATLADFQAAHGTDEFRRLVTLEGWDEFPSRPALYEVLVVAEAGTSAAGTSAAGTSAAGASAAGTAMAEPALR
jgi:hypothetical protein